MTLREQLLANVENTAQALDQLRQKVKTSAVIPAGLPALMTELEKRASDNFRMAAQMFDQVSLDR